MDIFYTSENNVNFVCSKLEFSKYDLVIEPSGGNGSFIKYFQKHNISYYSCDINPQYETIVREDFLNLDTKKFMGKILTLGNPPFGKNNSLTTKFFNKAANFSRVIGFIVPKSFRKPSVQKRLNRNFHLIEDFELVDQNYVNESGKIQLVPTIFQIWEYRDELRVLENLKLVSNVINFVSRENANYAIRRVGVNAGKCFKDTNKSLQSHYFIKTNIEDFDIKFNKVKFEFNDDVGCHSLTKNQIIIKSENL
jgi:hypothetical protein